MLLFAACFAMPNSGLGCANDCGKFQLQRRRESSSRVKSEFLSTTSGGSRVYHSHSRKPRISFDFHSSILTGEFTRIGAIPKAASRDRQGAQEPGECTPLSCNATQRNKRKKPFTSCKSETDVGNSPLLLKRLLLVASPKSPSLRRMSLLKKQVAQFQIYPQHKSVSTDQE